VGDPQSYEAWIRAAFKHRYFEDNDKKWYMREGVAYPFDADRSQALPYLIKTFEGAHGLIGAYSHAQVGDGLWFLVGEAAGRYVEACLIGPAPEKDKLRLLLAIRRLFTGFFAEHGADQGDEIGTTAYMWWDIDGLSWDSGARLSPKIRKAYLGTLERLLRSRSLVCQKSALHGVAHWVQRGRSPQARRILKDFAARAPQKSKIRSYLKDALAGKML
jgi:hypothetical protein